MRPNLLEEYLDRVEKHLRRLPDAERQEWRDEARQHLLALAVDHTELGCTPEEALEVAIRQFGEPDRLGKELLAYSSVGLRDRQASHRVGWALHTLSWNVVVTILAVTLAADHPELAWSLPAALTVFCLGHALGGALFGWQTRRSNLIQAVGLPYVSLVIAGIGLTGTLDAFSVVALAAASAAVAAGLALGALTASLVSRSLAPVEGGLTRLG